MMKELTVVSGKGGTGKTSVVASFASLAEEKVIVDADVDAADLHLVIPPDIKNRTEFKGGHIAKIDGSICTECGDCAERCRFNAISDDFTVDEVACEGCGVCVHFCPAGAIKFPQRTCGEWYISETRNGTMVHAKLGIAEENSGLLVSLLRKEAKKIAETENLKTIIVDGPPGIGCPVIASITGSTAVLIISEPTMSGMHDMKRVNELSTFLDVPAMLCINKFDINPEMSEKMKSYARETGLKYVGSIPYDRDVTAAMVARKSLVELSEGKGAQAVKKVWEKVAMAMAL